MKANISTPFVYHCIKSAAKLSKSDKNAGQLFMDTMRYFGTEPDINQKPFHNYTVINKKSYYENECI
ncbi:hypothetical protein AB669_08155 [Pedobacter sp. BMA]|nr:hypothetical protein AB669_08155 [Pedobacter sp. BMA]